MYIKPPSERVLLANKQFVVNMVTEELAELLSRPLSLALLSAATLLIARHLTRVLEENKRTEAELRSIGTHLREKRRRHSAGGWQKGRTSCHRRGIEGGDRNLADLLLAADAVDPDHLYEPFDHARRRLAAMYPEISRGNDEPRRGCPGSCSVRRRAGRVQLVHGQLCAPCGVGRFSEPRGIPASGAGPDRW